MAAAVAQSMLQMIRQTCLQVHCHQRVRAAALLPVLRPLGLARRTDYQR